MHHFLPIEEVNDKASNLPHLLAAMNPSPAVSVLGVPNREDIQSAGFQNPPYFSREGLQFRCRQRHAVQHMGVAGIEGFICKQEALSDVQANPGDLMVQPCRVRLRCDRVNGSQRVIGSGDVKPLPAKNNVSRPWPLPSSKIFRRPSCSNCLAASIAGLLGSNPNISGFDTNV